MNLKTIAAMALDELELETDVYMDDEDDSVVYEDPVQYVVSKDDYGQSSVAEDSSVFSDALDEMIGEGDEGKSPAKDGYQTFVFKFKINAPKFAKRLGVEIPDDSSDALDAAIRECFLSDVQDAATVTGSRRARNFNGQSPWVRPHSDTPLENCRAENPMTCRFHGSQAIANEVEAAVQRAFQRAGRQFDGNVNVEIQNVEGSTLTCAVSVSAPGADRDVIYRAMADFAQLPGVVSDDTFERTRGGFLESFDLDYDTLDPDAKARWGMGEERPAEGGEQGQEEQNGGEDVPETAAETETETASAQQQEEAPVEEPESVQDPRQLDSQQRATLNQMASEVTSFLDNATGPELAEAERSHPGYSDGMRRLAELLRSGALNEMLGIAGARNDSAEETTSAPTEAAEPEQDVLAPAAAAEEAHEEAAAQTEQAPSEESAAPTQEVSAQPTEAETTAQPQAGISDLDGAVAAAVAANGQIPALTYREAIEGALNGDEADRRFLERKLGAGSPVLGWIDGQRGNGGGAAGQGSTSEGAGNESDAIRNEEAASPARENEEPEWRSMSHDSRDYWHARWNSENHGDLDDPTDDELEHALAVLGENDPVAREMMDRYNSRHGTNIRNYHDAAVESGELEPERPRQEQVNGTTSPQQQAPETQTTTEQTAPSSAEAPQPTEAPRPSPTPVQATTPAQHAVAEAQAHEVAPQFVSATPIANPYSAAQDQSPSRNEAVSDDLRNNLIAEYNRAKGEKQRLGQLLMEQGITVAGRNGEQVPDFNNRESGAAMKARRFASYLSALGKVIGGYSHRRPTAAERRAHPDQIGEDGRITFQAGHQLGGFNNRGDMMNRMQSVMMDAFNAARENPLGQGSTQYKRTKDALRFLGSKLGANVTVDDSNGNLNVEWTDHPNNDTFDYGYIDEGRTASDARAERGGSQSAGEGRTEIPTASAQQQVAEPAAPAENNTTQRPNAQGQSAAAQSLAQSIQNVQNPQVRDILQRIQARASGRQ